MRRYENLRCYQRADAVVLAIYEDSREFPHHETYALRSQIRRSAVSIVSNIVEGTSRSSTKELRQFVSCAYGSARELYYQWELAIRLGYACEGQLLNDIDAVAADLFNLRRSLDRKISAGL